MPIRSCTNSSFVITILFFGTNYRPVEAWLGSCRRFSKLGRDCVRLAAHEVDAGADPGLATNALLISSLSDGLENCGEALAFMKEGLLKKMLKDAQIDTQRAIEESAQFSPCNGPDVAKITDLETIDSNVDNLTSLCGTSSVSDILGGVDQPTLRLVYVPTAMLALRRDSISTPGKQRRRARADAKKRRDGIVNLLEGLLENRVNVLSVTLDFVDGSIKQKDGSENDSDFPEVSCLGWLATPEG